MKITSQGDTLVASDITELSAATAGGFRDEIRAALRDARINVDIDLSQTRFLDSGGLGALIAIQKSAAERGGRVRLINPASRVQQILELTRLHCVFEIVRV